MKNFVQGVVFAVIALALGGWLYLRFGFAEVCANVPLSRLDSEIASTALHASVVDGIAFVVLSRFIEVGYVALFCSEVSCSGCSEG
jgi:hypothetical protein